MKVLELFSGTHSIGVVAKEFNFDVVSLDRDLDAKSKIYNYTSPHHIKQDILKWDYKKDFKQGDFDIITASPVCLFWSCLRNCWIGRKLKNSDEIVSKATLQRDIDLYGKPMVDKVFEIIDYFKPKYYWIENPTSSSMWKYIKSKWDFDKNERFLNFDYCKYSDWGYRKPTTFLTNIPNIIPKKCKNDCENMKEDTNKHNDKCANITYYKKPCGEIVRLRTKELRAKAEEDGWIKITNKHQKNINDIGGGNNRLGRYRIPKKIIEELFKNCI